MKFISCQNCYRKLLKIGMFDELSIKCPRCKNINHIMSVTNAPFEDHESLNTIGATRGNSKKINQKTIQ